MKKWSLFLLITLVVMLMPVTTEAANWKYIARSTNGIMAYLDTSSISGSSYGPKDAWVKYEHHYQDCASELAIIMNKCISKKLIYERHFSDTSMCNLQQIVYFTDGTDDGGSQESCNPQSIPPNSLAEAVWNHLYQ